MASADVPAWLALAGAGITAGAVLAGAALNARSTRNTERARLQQERDLFGAPEQIKSLETAIATASRLREEIAAALKWFDAPDDERKSPDQGLWQWTTQSRFDVKEHEAALKLRFGTGKVTTAWENLEWCLAGAAVFCQASRPAADPAQPISEEVRSEARDWRTWTRLELESFVVAAGTAVAPAA